MKTLEVTRSYLQMLCVSELQAAKLAAERGRVEQVMHCPASFFRYLYSEVGRNYRWVDRGEWTDEQIRAYLSQPNISLWVLYCAGAPAGYFELCRHEDNSVEIVYFGLLEEFIGCGLGKYLLTVAVDRAWEQAASRIWLHTCTLDHPRALSNYLKRGFKVFRQEIYSVAVGEI